MSLFRRATTRSFADDDPELVRVFGEGRPALSGKRVSRQRALQMMAVWRCVSLIASGVSTLPIDVYNKIGDKRKPVPTPEWLLRPQAWQTPADFWHRVVSSLLLEGNAFIWTQRDGRGNIVGTKVLDPRRVEVEEKPRTQEIAFKVDGVEFDRSFILWIPAFTVTWQLRGLSPIDAARQAIDLGLTVEEYGARFFHQGASMAGVIEHPGSPSPDEAEMLRNMFRKKHSGVSNSHAIGVLTGAATWKSITITPEQAQFLETRKFQKGEVALLFGVPPYMVDPSVTSSWGSGVTEQNSFFITYTLQPWIIRIEQALSLFLLPGKQEVKFNVDARLRPNTKERYAAYKAGIEMGLINRDEARAREDLEPIPDGLGQVFYRPLNMAPLGVGPYETDENGRTQDDPEFGKPSSAPDDDSDSEGDKKKE